MTVLATLEGADVVAWVCLVVGIAVLGTGLVIGYQTALARPSPDATQSLTEARTQLEVAEEALAAARQQMTDAAQSGLEGAGGAAAGEVEAAAASAEASTGAAKSALDQVQGIVGALPENLRFAGMLVLVGAVLMSVATIQFGGTSLF